MGWLEELRLDRRGRRTGAWTILKGLGAAVDDERLVGGRPRAGLRTIAHRLNAEAVAPPRAQRDETGSWSFSSILALLGNPIYRGERIWSRSEWIKNREAGKRRRFEPPSRSGRSEEHTSELQSLRHLVCRLLP